MYAKLSYRVLLIEDDPSDAHLVSRYLKLSTDVGFELTWVVSLSEGLAQLRKDEHDILLLDLSLPDSKGLETVKAIRSSDHSTLPLIVLTGHDDTGFALDILESGVQDYLIKGRFDGDALIRAIRYALHRSKLEQRLHEAEERWRFALEGAGDGVWDWNLLTNEVFYSPRWKALLGFSENEIGNNLDEWEKRVYPLDLPIAEANIQAHLDGRVESYGCEHRLKCKSGQWRWFMDRGVVVSWTDEGLPQRMIGTLSDITNRKNMEQELQQSKQFAVSTIDALSAHICVLDKYGTIVAVNRAWREFYQNNAGASSNCISVIDSNYLAVCDCTTDESSEQATQMAAGIRSVMKGDVDIFEMEYPCHSDNEERWFNARVTPFKDSNEYIVVAHEDITDRKQAEARDRLLIAALEAVGHGIVITDTSARIEWANPAFGKLTGYTLEEALGKAPKDLVKSGKQDSLFYDDMWQTIRSGKTWCGELINKRKNGDLYDEELTIAPVTDDKGKITHFVGIKQDISERKRLEAELIQLATTDPLTGLPNRRRFMERLSEEINRSERNSSHQVAVLMLDLDNFKTINDRYGHAVGDQVLKHFSAILRNELRKIDSVGRLGGEEFGIFLPETSLSDAGIFAERLRQELAQTPLLADGQSIVTTVSIGISELISKDIQADSVLIRADQALYRAKKNGRNRVEFYNGS